MKRKKLRKKKKKVKKKKRKNEKNVKIILLGKICCPRNTPTSGIS